MSEEEAGMMLMGLLTVALACGLVVALVAIARKVWGRDAAG